MPPAQGKVAQSFKVLKW